MKQFDFGYLIPDPKRPGPKYYSECKRFNWTDKLIENHQKHIAKINGEDVYAIEYTADELALM